MTRFLASVGALIIASISLIALNPVTVSAADTYRWLNDATIVRVIQNGNSNKSVNFIDGNPLDNNRTFKEQGATSYCNNGAVDTITLVSPSSGSLYYVSTPAPTGGGVGGGTRGKIDCEVKAIAITIVDIDKAMNYSNPCTGTPDQEDKCMLDRQFAGANAVWARDCRNPSDPNAAAICDTKSTPTPPGGQNAGNNNGTTNGNGAKPDECDSLGGFSMRWLMCPILKATLQLTSALDEMIVEGLTYDMSNFDRSTPQGEAFFTAWNAFRMIAMALILLVLLIMIGAQAIDMPVVSALSLRKSLMSAAIYVFVIFFMWDILRLGYGFTNDLGSWVYDLVLAPFKGAAKTTNSPGGAEFLGISVAVIAAISGAAAYLRRLGPNGIMSLVGTVVIVVIIAWLAAEGRDVLLGGGVILSSIFLALGIVLPGVRKMYWNGIITLCAMYPAIMFLLGITQAMAMVSDEGLVKIIIIVLGYIGIPTIIIGLGSIPGKLVGGVMDQGRGWLDKSKKYRQRIGQERDQKFHSGAFYDQDKKLGRTMNRLGATIGAAKTADWGKGKFFGAKNKQVRASMLMAAKDDAARDPFLKAQEHDEEAMMARALGNNVSRMARMTHFQNADGTADMGKINAAIGRTGGMKADVATRMAAADNLIQSGKLIQSRKDADLLYASASGGDIGADGKLTGGISGTANLYGANKGAGQWKYRQVGRSDIGRSTDFEVFEELSAADISKLKPVAARNLFGAEGQASPMAGMLTKNEVLEKYDSNGAPVYRKLSQEERQHIVDIAYASQFSPYTNAYQQKAIAQAWNAVPEEAKRQAEKNYAAKAMGGRSMDPNDMAQSMAYRLPMPPPQAAPAPVVVQAAPQAAPVVQQQAGPAPVPIATMAPSSGGRPEVIPGVMPEPAAPRGNRGRASSTDRVEGQNFNSIGQGGAERQPTTPANQRAQTNSRGATYASGHSQGYVGASLAEPSPEGRYPSGALPPTPAPTPPPRNDGPTVSRPFPSNAFSSPPSTPPSGPPTPPSSPDDSTGPSPQNP